MPVVKLANLFQMTFCACWIWEFCKINFWYVLCKVWRGANESKISSNKIWWWMKVQCWIKSIFFIQHRFIVVYPTFKFSNVHSEFETFLSTTKWQSKQLKQLLWISYFSWLIQMMRIPTKECLVVGWNAGVKMVISTILLRTSGWKIDKNLSRCSFLS